MHATEKMLEEVGEKAEPEERAQIEAAVSELKEVVTGDSQDAIEAKIKGLSEASAGLAQKLYAEQTEQANADNPEATEGGVDEENVVDAEFEEIKEDDEQKSA